MNSRTMRSAAATTNTGTMIAAKPAPCSADRGGTTTASAHARHSPEADTDSQTKATIQARLATGSGWSFGQPVTSGPYLPG